MASTSRNWLAKMRPEVAAPAAPEGRFDRIALAIIGVALAAWAFAPESGFTGWAALAGGIVVAVRLARWRGLYTLREPLLLILHLGYGWLSVGLVLLGANRFLDFLPATAALHALTVGAIGTMTLAVMTRASLGHTGRPLTAGPSTRAIYVLITLAAVLRVFSPLMGEGMELSLLLAGAGWSAAFGLFAVFYGRALASPRAGGEAARPI